MAAIDEVNRVFREFLRYTGDGLPNEPAGAPLPVGDPSSGVHSPKKSELRTALLAPIAESGEAAQAVIDEHLPVIIAAKDAAEESASDAAASLAALLARYLGSLANDAAATAAAGTPQPGQLYFNTTSSVWRYWDGDSWESIPYTTVADDAVTSQKIVAGAVTRPKLPDALSRGMPVNVFEHGAAGDDTTDDAAAFNAAIVAAAATDCKIVLVPGYTYLINSPIDILDDVTLIFEGATLRTSLDTVTILRADTVHNWNIEGRVTLLGTGAGSGTVTQKGLSIEDCYGFHVRGVLARDIMGYGFHVLGDGDTARGDGKQFSDCSAYGCRYGRRIDAGAGGEYTTWTNWHASGNYIADSIAAGNTQTSGGVVSMNQGGVELRSGGNDGHGIYTGVSITHNTAYNLEAIDIGNGYTFTGCNFYENDIILRRSNGIFIRGGILDCRFINDADSGTGYNGCIDNWMPGDYFSTPTVIVTLSDDGTGYSKFKFGDNEGPGAS